MCTWLHVPQQEGLELRSQLHVTATGVRGAAPVRCAGYWDKELSSPPRGSRPRLLCHKCQRGSACALGCAC